MRHLPFAADVFLPNSESEATSNMLVHYYNITSYIYTFFAANQLTNDYRFFPSSRFAGIVLCMLISSMPSCTGSKVNQSHVVLFRLFNILI